MQLQSKNLNKSRLVAWLLYAIFEILIQVVFRICFFIGQEIIFFLVFIWVDQESTYSIFQHLTVFWVSGKFLHRIINKIQARYATKKYEKYDPTSDLKTCGHISFEMLSPKFHPDCRYLRYLRYIYLKVEKKMSCKIKPSCCWHGRA